MTKFKEVSGEELKTIREQAEDFSADLYGIIRRLENCHIGTPADGAHETISAFLQLQETIASVNRALFAPLRMLQEEKNIRAKLESRAL